MKGIREHRGFSQVSRFFIAALSSVFVLLITAFPSSADWESYVRLTNAARGNTDQPISVVKRNNSGDFTSTVGLNSSITASQASLETANITLHEGWNLISLQILPADTNISSVLASILPNLIVIWSCSGGGNGGGTWSCYVPGGPSSLFTIEAGKGYWIHMKAGGPYALTYKGIVCPVPPTSPPSFTYAPGWNLIGFKSKVPMSAATYLAGTYYRTPIYAGGDQLQAYVPLDNNPIMMPGFGYWVYFFFTATVSPGCGRMTLGTHQVTTSTNIGTGPHSSSLSIIVATSQSPVSIPNIIIQSALLSSLRVTPGTPVTVTANVANRGIVNGATRITLYVNGQEESSQGVTVNSGCNTPVTFSVSRNEPGTYSVYVGGTNAGSFTVDELADPNIILYISMACIFFSLVTGVFYILRRRQQY